MAKITTSNGSPRASKDSKPRRDHPESFGAAQKAPQKSSRRPAKSNITVVTHDSSSSEEESGNDDDDEDDGSDADDDDVLDEEPDVSALPGAMSRRANGKTRGLAGHAKNNDDMDDAMDMTDAEDAGVGAETEDDDYGDVEGVDPSDGENSVVDAGEDSLLRFAEQDLIHEFEKTEQRHNSSSMWEGLTDMSLRTDAALARRLSLHSADDTHEDLHIDMDEDPFAGLPSSETLYNDMLQDAELAIWRMPHAGREEENDASGLPQKRVRFEETRSRASSESSSEDGDGDCENDFPDLFAEADDPILKHRLALASAQEAQMALNDFADAESLYDFDGEDEKIAFELDEGSSSDEDESSDDSEDDGDTTDEESPEEQIARMQAMKKALGKTAPVPNTPPTARKVVTKSARTTPTGRVTAAKLARGPVQGTFALDPTRASLLANATGTKIQVRPPIKPLEREKPFWERARSVNNSRHGSPQGTSYLTIPSPSASSVPSRPFTAQSTLGSMFDGKLDIIRNNDVSGIAEDLYPAMMLQPQSSFVASTATEDSDDEGQDIDMRDFIDMDFSSSEDEEPSSASVMSPKDGDVFSTFPPENERTPKLGNGLLEHLSQYRGIVGSFRRNQHNAKHISSLASHPAKRASASEYNALQKGRRAAGNSPMTPARKARAHSDLSTPLSNGIKKNVSSPLATRRPRSRGESISGVFSRVGLHQTLSSSPFK